MNDNEIYELLSKTFDNKVKPDFEDVKKRIANLSEQKNDTVISPAPFKRKKTAATFSIAAAACLVLICGISTALVAANSDNKNECTSNDLYTATYNMATDAREGSDAQSGAMKFGIFNEEATTDEATTDEATLDCDDFCVESLKISDSDITTDCISDSDVQ